MHVDTNRTALLIVDMQQYQAGEGGNLPRALALFNGPEAETRAVKKARELISVIRKLLLAFRSMRGKVVYTTFGLWLRRPVVLGFGDGGHCGLLNSVR